MPRKDPKEPFLIAAAVESSSAYGRKVLLGIRRFIKANPEHNWVAVIEQRDLHSDAPKWLKDWNGHGLISRHTTKGLRRALKSKGIPFVDITDRHSNDDAFSIRSDDYKIGEIAAEHLSNCFLPHFAFCGFDNEAWSDRRGKGFRKHPALAGNHVHQFSSDWYIRDVKQWEDEEKKLTK